VIPGSSGSVATWRLIITYLRCAAWSSPALSHRSDCGGSPAIKGILAIITLVKFTLDPLLSPDLMPCSSRVCLKVLVPFSVIAVDCGFCYFNGTVITIVYDSSSHAAENRFDDVEELGPCR